MSCANWIAPPMKNGMEVEIADIIYAAALGLKEPESR
jgi:hypothetical protein